MGETVKVTLTGSKIGSTKKIRQKTVIRKDTPEIRGMLRKVQHLVTVEED
jgi:large subunit ribosomal protein L30